MRTADYAEGVKGMLADRVAIVQPVINHVTVSDWAEKHRTLPPDLSPLPGPFRWDVVPYLREIADCFSETSPVQEVAVMKGARIGFTTAVLENWIGYVIDAAPGPMMFISGDADTAKISVELKVDRMIESAGLQGKIFAQTEKKANKKSGDTKSKKEFPGGFLLPVGPNVAAKLRVTGIRYGALDELDAYPDQLGAQDKTKGKRQAEGDPVSLFRKRTADWERQRKILYGSTPTVKQRSKIEKLFLDGDQRYFNVPCKYSDCGHKQRLRWEQMKYEKDETGHLVLDSVHYDCEKCGRSWKNDDKAYFLPAGEWIPTSRARRPNLQSYHINSLYSPIGMATWETICQEWIDAQGNPDQLRVFFNTVLGETWEERGEAPLKEPIRDRAFTEAYQVGGDLPPYARPLIVTAGADVHPDAIYLEFVAWARDKESWSLEYLVIPAEDTSNLSDPCWQQLQKAFFTPHGTLPTMMALVDSGHQTTTVYSFCENCGAPNNLMPSKGDSLPSSERAIFTISKNVPVTTCRLILLNTDKLKQEVYGNLRIGTPDGNPPKSGLPGYCHFPAGYDKHYYDGLTSESRHDKPTPRGGLRKVWQEHGANEPLDCRQYALAALYVFHDLYSEELREELELYDENEQPRKLTWHELWSLLEQAQKKP